MSKSIYLLIYFYILVILFVYLYIYSFIIYLSFYFIMKSSSVLVVYYIIHDLTVDLSTKVLRVFYCYQTW